MSSVVAQETRAVGLHLPFLSATETAVSGAMAMQGSVSQTSSGGVAGEVAAPEPNSPHAARSQVSTAVSVDMARPAGSAAVPCRSVEGDSALSAAEAEGEHSSLDPRMAELQNRRVSRPVYGNARHGGLRSSGPARFRPKASRSSFGARSPTCGSYIVEEPEFAAPPASVYGQAGIAVQMRSTEAAVSQPMQADDQCSAGVDAIESQAVGEVTQAMQSTEPGFRLPLDLNQQSASNFAVSALAAILSIGSQQRGITTAENALQLLEADRTVADHVSRSMVALPALQSASLVASIIRQSLERVGSDTRRQGDSVSVGLQDDTQQSGEAIAAILEHAQTESRRAIHARGTARDECLTRDSEQNQAENGSCGAVVQPCLGAEAADVEGNVSDGVRIDFDCGQVAHSTANAFARMPSGAFAEWNENNTEENNVDEAVGHGDAAPRPSHVSLSVNAEVSVSHSRIPRRHPDALTSTANYNRTSVGLLAGPASPQFGYANEFFEQPTAARSVLQGNSRVRVMSPTVRQATSVEAAVVTDTDRYSDDGNNSPSRAVSQQGPLLGSRAGVEQCNSVVSPSKQVRASPTVSSYVAKLPRATGVEVATMEGVQVEAVHLVATVSIGDRGAASKCSGYISAQEGEGGLPEAAERPQLSTAGVALKQINSSTMLKSEVADAMQNGTGQAVDGTSKASHHRSRGTALAARTAGEVSRLRGHMGAADDEAASNVAGQQALLGALHSVVTTAAAYHSTGRGNTPLMGGPAGREAGAEQVQQADALGTCSCDDGVQCQPSVYENDEAGHMEMERRDVGRGNHTVYGPWQHHTESTEAVCNGGAYSLQNEVSTRADGQHWRRGHANTDQHDGQSLVSPYPITAGGSCCSPKSGGNSWSSSAGKRKRDAMKRG